MVSSNKTASSVKTIVISGYYGFKNSGDEAVLQSVLTALAEEGKAAGVIIEPVVLSIDPEWTSKAYGVRAVHRMKLGEVRRAIRESDGLISGGGSLLQDATSPKTIPYYLGVIKIAQLLRKPVFIYAQGIGPVNRKLFHPMIRSVFRKCAYISVRDAQSAELLQSMGIRGEDIHVVPDPVMGLPLPEAMRSEMIQDKAKQTESEAYPETLEVKSDHAEALHTEAGQADDSQAVTVEAEDSRAVPYSTSSAETDQEDMSDRHAGHDRTEAGEAAPVTDPESLEAGTLAADSDPEALAANPVLPVVGISVRFWDQGRRELNAIAEGLAALAKKRPVHFRFLPFHRPGDEEASRYIAERMGDITSYGGQISFFLEEEQPQDMLREVDQCDLILGMRLHSLIYAANRAVPLIGISYDPKIDHFLKRLGSAPIGTSDSLAPQDLTRHMESLLEAPEAWKEEHADGIGKLKDEAVLPARHIVEYLGNRR